MDSLTKREQPDRSKINMHQAFEVKHWTHALGVSKEELKRAVDRVGNSAAAVRKELAKEQTKEQATSRPRGAGTQAAT